MSWQEWVEKVEKSIAQYQTGKSSYYAAIYGKQGGVWAESASTTFKITNDEAVNLARVIDTLDMNVHGTGVTCGDKKFTVLRLEPETIILQGKANKDDAIVATCSQQAIILGYSGVSECKAPQIRVVVEGVKDYFKGVGY